MDTPELRAGVTCYLGVNVEGALVSLGDGHARQGEGEACGVAVEAAMESVIVDLIKGHRCPWPRIESDSHLMSTGSARPLEDAFRIAQADMVSWVSGDFGRTSSTRTNWSPKPLKRRSRTSSIATTPVLRSWRSAGCQTQKCTKGLIDGFVRQQPPTARRGSKGPVAGNLRTGTGSESIGSHRPRGNPCGQSGTEAAQRPRSHTGDLLGRRPPGKLVAKQKRLT